MNHTTPEFPILFTSVVEKELLPWQPLSLAPPLHFSVWFWLWCFWVAELPGGTLAPDLERVLETSPFWRCTPWPGLREGSGKRGGTSQCLEFFLSLLKVGWPCYGLHPFSELYPGPLVVFTTLCMVTDCSMPSWKMTITCMCACVCGCKCVRCTCVCMYLHLEAKKQLQVVLPQEPFSSFRDRVPVTWNSPSRPG